MKDEKQDYEGRIADLSTQIQKVKEEKDELTREKEELLSELGLE